MARLWKCLLLFSLVLAGVSGGGALGMWLAPYEVMGPKMPPAYRIFDYMRDVTVRIRTAVGNGSGVTIAAWETSTGWTMAILTAEHVVDELEDDKVIVERWEGTDSIVSPGRVMYTHGEGPWDMAIVWVEGRAEAWPVAQVLRPARASEVQAGMRVWIAGYPTDGYPHITDGYISDVGGTAWEPYFRTSAGISYGNSGGPMFLSDGRVVSIGVRVNVRPGIPVWHISLGIPPTNMIDFIQHIIILGFLPDDYGTEP